MSRAHDCLPRHPVEDWGQAMNLVREERLVGKPPRETQTLYREGKEEPLHLVWPDSHWDKTVAAWGYDEFFALGDEDMGAEDEDGEQDASWQADVSVQAYLADPCGDAPYAYCAMLSNVCQSRVVYFETLTDLFTFCNLAASVLRLNYETRPKANRGRAYMFEEQRKNRLIAAARRREGGGAA
jgi:hypothetical protein